jgi:sodium transport system permease protein
MREILTVARKEIVDGMRDFRSVMASTFYALMGPVVVGLVSLAVKDKSGSSTVLTGMMAVFTLVAAFVGGMNVAMDTVAGERERRSLLPLLLNAVPRESIVVGKWLAVSFFAVVGLAIDVVGFAVVFALCGIHVPTNLISLLAVAAGLGSLALLAAAAQLLISTASHAAKEAQTYLSLIVFAPMGIGMFLVFSPAARLAWLSYLPLMGQQLQLEAWVNGREIGIVQPLILAWLTVSFAVLLLLVSTNRLRRDEILYGN